MIKKLCVAGAVLAAATTAALVAAPAQAESADRWSNWASNHRSAQSGNLFGKLVTTAAGGAGSANVNNINGTVANATNGSVTVFYSFR
ncbi:hypothetical protein DP939_40725 [Spongiactinospora rosea]|uniref:Pectate lyase n=1 Tax=Spongiactinospora rosea TaxID=2248750 RepID=A0A366LLQ1_9ACTN|nr:hypothetical protein [Spongiactinospora rosea]RBQ14433.1 hypothetical protein DP939_40725 [Spongiactinospora rosea]